LKNKKQSQEAVMLWSSAVPAFFASLVEFVEALTIVLAIGVSVNWKSSLSGAAAAAALLAVLVAAFGATLLQLVPIEVLRLIVGVILIAFGLQWLKKALLRYGGIKAVRNEAAIFERQRQAAGSREQKTFSRFGFFTSFKSVLIEGLEVAFIVLTVGATASGSGGLWSAAAGAFGALVLVILMGLLIRRPLTRVPENSLKFVVGWLLVTFGVFWAGEGLGFEWPGADWFLFALGAVLLAECLLLVGVLKRKAARGKAEPAEGPPPQGAILRVLYALFDFFCGDWWIASGVIVTLIAAFCVPLSGYVLAAGALLTLALTVDRGSSATKSLFH
jgi:uncharacterized membrane protein